jgi:hypothetical protein
MPDPMSSSSNKSTAGGSVTLQESTDFTALPATLDKHNTQVVSFADKIDKAESIRFSSGFKT